MTQAYDKLKELLEELFQFDRGDLDFGIYRIMNQKRAEVSKFLDHDLLPQVQQAFGEYQTGDVDRVSERMAEIEQAASRFNADPDQDPEYQELRERTARGTIHPLSKTRCTPTCTPSSAATTRTVIS